MVCRSVGSANVGVDERELGIWDSLDEVVGIVEVDDGRDEASMGTVDAVDEKKDDAVEVEELLRFCGCCAMLLIAVPAATDGTVDDAAEAPGPLLGLKSLFVVGDVGACIVGVDDVDRD